jgi:3-dehydroquinate dehydratase II
VRVLVLHGPNLNMLGTREPEIYGTLTLADIDARVRERATALGMEVETAQSNGEGDLIDLIQRAKESFDALVINPGGYSHTSVAIRDAIASVGLPAIEVHLSNPAAREDFRKIDIVAGVCMGVVAGFGWRSYLMAIDALAATATD